MTETPTAPSTLEQLRAIKTFEELATFLEVSHSHLRFVLYDKKYSKYKSFEIPKRKKSETRKISVPNWALDQLQHRLLAVFQDIYQPRGSVYGFTRGRSIVANAHYHRKGRKIRHLLNVDLKDFFPSIHLGRVKGLLTAKPYELNSQVATWIAQIVSTYDGLPQGACTSPIISNMVCNKLDTQLSRFAQKYRCRYTRYADDLVFSSTEVKFPPAVKHENLLIDVNQAFLSELDDIIVKQNKFQINESKVKLQTPNERQEVTGLVVNEFVNVPRKFIREVRAMLHDWDVNGLERATENHLTKRQKHRSPNKGRLDFRSVVRGKIEFIGMVRGKNDSIYRKLFIKYSRLMGKPLDSLYDKSAKPDVFISYKREDRAQAENLRDRLTDYGFNVWLDKRELRGGKEWKAAIFEAIAETACFIALCSESYRQRLNSKQSIIRQEVDAALARTKATSKEQLCFIPVRLDASKPYPKLFHHIQGCDFPAEFDGIAHSIAEHLKMLKSYE